MVTKSRSRLLVVITLMSTVVPAVTLPRNAYAQKSQGQATTEIERWRADIAKQSKDVRDVQKDILGLTKVFREETKTLSSAHDKFLKDKDRRELTRSTADSLDKIARSAAEILKGKEKILLGLLDSEKKIRDFSASYRAESESISADLPSKASELFKLQLSNDELKDEYAKDPSRRDLERKLRDAFRKEVRTKDDLDFLKKRAGLLKAAATKLDEKAGHVEDLYDDLDAVYDALEVTHNRVTNQSKILRVLDETEKNLEVFTGTSDLHKLHLEIAGLTGVAEDVSRTLSSVMNSVLEPEPGAKAGGARKVPDSGFDRWLHERLNKKK